MTTIPSSADKHGDSTPALRVVRDTEVLGPEEFVQWALRWRDSGYSPLVLGGKNGKKLLVRHITGYSPHDATEAQIRSWSTQFRHLAEVTLGIRCPQGVIGLDVDAYDGKRGLKTLAEHAERLGKLPPTYITTARDDGSGIRWYRVPSDWRGHDLKADDGSKGHVELIQRHHRYSVVPPSNHHTGSTYRLYGPDGGEIESGVLPTQSELPGLPGAWLDGLETSTRAETTTALGGSQPDAVAAWLDEWIADDYSHGLSQVITRFHRLVKDGKKDRHHAMIDALTLALKESRAGGYPARRAESELRAVWLAAIAANPGHDEAEFDAMFPWAIGRAESDDHDDRWLIMRRNYGEDTRLYPDLGDLRIKPANVASNLATLEDEGGQDQLATVCLAEVAPTSVKWLWKGWLPLGKVSIFEGDSDVGKSTLTLSWASIVSTGSRWPPTVINGKTLISQHDPAGVVLVGVEDANDDTVVPRLIAAGADLDHIYALRRQNDTLGNPVPFTIPHDIDLLRTAIVETDAKLVVIDPITACLPEDAKHGVDSSIRRILMSLVDLARETQSAIVLIRHFNKASGMSAKHRGGGSVAYSALVRSVISAGKLSTPADDGARFAVARAIGNLSKPPETIGYRLEDAPDLPALPKAEDDELRISVVTWCGTVGIDADQLVGADDAKVTDSRKSAPTRESAAEAIRDMLTSGAQKAQDVITTVAMSEQCSTNTVKAAAKEVGVVKKKIYSNGKVDHWTWELPPTVLKISAGKDGT